MNIISKKSIFILIGLLIVGMTFFMSKSSIVEASNKEGKKFDDWVVTCMDIDQNNTKTCFLSQQINISKDDKTQTLAIYQIGYVNNQLKMLTTLPLGISVEAGTSIISSKNLLAKGKFTTCTNAGCQSVSDISKDELKKILSTNENSVAFMNVEGKQINLPISVKGLEKGLAFLRK